MAEGLRVPYSQQFTPEQTPLNRLLPILRQHSRKPAALKTAIASAFFKKTASPEKIAGNTLIALKTYGVIDADCLLSEFGKALIALQDNPTDAARLLAKRILLDLNGVPIVETIREMRQARAKISLGTLPTELTKRGFLASKNSSDLSGVLGWLRTAGVLNDYDVSDAVYQELTGSTPATIGTLKGLESNQVLFLRAMISLGVTDWASFERIARHAEGLYSGQVAFNWKDIPKTVLRPLQAQGLIELRKREKATEGGRGGKPADVRPTAKCVAEVAEPLLKGIYGAAGYEQVRQIAAKPWDDLLKEIQTGDNDTKARALELLAIRIGQLLDLRFMGLRETDEAKTGGAEIDGMLHSARLIYSRWQIQCKASASITVEALAKEVGLYQVTLANVILIVGTGSITQGAKTYREAILRRTNLNIIVLEGKDLKRIGADPSCITEILTAQAADALNLKGLPEGVKPPPGSAGGGKPSGGKAPECKADSPKGVEPRAAIGPFRLAYSTNLGRLYQGDSLDVLRYLADSGVRAKLIVTSPPFALVRKKEYGNEDAAQYVDWFAGFLPLFESVLAPEGSLVIDIGGSWGKGLPVKSTYHLELVLRILKSGFYLAQEFYHYNPARLPTPAEWVTVRRLRLKDAVNTVWWFVRDPMAPADNRKVLRPYSESMQALLKNGYKAKLRPSGHNISTKFQKDNGGSIAPNMIPADPTNLLSLANTESNSRYLKECNAHGIKPHPARFPQELPEFFIKFLTEPGELVIDPFAGSNVTGEVAERLERHWLGIELIEEYVRGSEFRFLGPEKDETAKKADVITLFPTQEWLPLLEVGRR